MSPEHKRKIIGSSAVFLDAKVSSKRHKFYRFGIIGYVRDCSHVLLEEFISEIANCLKSIPGILNQTKANFQ